MDTAPRWIRDLARLLPIRSQIVLAGNIRDSFPTPHAAGTTLAPVPLIMRYLELMLREIAGMRDAYECAGRSV